LAGPPADWALRRQLEDFARTAGNAALHERLLAVDPPLARRLNEHDVRRVIRGLEVFESTGRPLSDLQRQAPLAEDLRPPHVYWLAPPREWLYRQIDRRVELMFEAGLVAEVARLLEAPRPPGRTARQALGYKEVFDHLAGRIPLDEARRLVQARTRQFAKRQFTWFRNLEECVPLKVTGEEPPARIAALLMGFAGTDSAR
jgi:tRNA dimethylallyltransferase